LQETQSENTKEKEKEIVDKRVKMIESPKFKKRATIAGATIGFAFLGSLVAETV